jgi:hypothetical protein
MPAGVASARSDAMAITNALAGIAVNDVGAAVHWYSRLIGRPPDRKPMPNVAEWRFENGSGVQLYEDEDRAGGSCVTLFDADLDKRIADFKAKNIPIQSRSSSAKLRSVTIEDDDGNRVVFMQMADVESAAG